MENLSGRYFECFAFDSTAKLYRRFDIMYFVKLMEITYIIYNSVIYIVQHTMKFFCHFVIDKSSRSSAPIVERRAFLELNH